MKLIEHVIVCYGENLGYQQGAKYQILSAYKNWYSDSNASICVVTDKPHLFDSYPCRILELVLLFAGGADNKVTEAFLEAKPTDLIKHPLSTAEAYIIERSAAERRLEWCSKNLIDKPADHFLTSIDQMLGITQYWTGVPLATQGSITGQFKTSLDSSRAKHSPLYLRLKYHYNRWRRQTLPRIYARMSSKRRSEI